MFANESCDSLTIRGSLPARQIEHTNDVGDVSDIKSYFARPRLITRTVYDAASFGTIWSLELTNDLIKSTMSVNFTRVQGGFGYRGTCCFRAQVVATPFMAGRLRFTFQPMSTGSVIDRTLNVTAASQLPGVELDLAEKTDMVIKIPFISPLNYFYINSSFPSETLGSIYLQRYQPLAVAAGVTPPSISVWGWIEDFEIIGTAATAVTPQMGKMNAAAIESKEIPGNLSNVLAAGSKLIGWAGTKIPVISSFSGPTAWALRQAAYVASSYGWAKPSDATSASKVFRTANTYQQNYDGIDTSFCMSGLADNAVAPMSGFAGTDLDEMSFDFLKSVRTAICEMSILTTNGEDTVLYACNVCPLSMFRSPNTRNVTAVKTAAPTGLNIWPSPLFGLGNAFKFYRGGFKFKIKIAKTKFHTGRLLLGFNPIQTQNPSTTTTQLPTDKNTGLFKSVIWDLREGNEMDFEVPFVSAVPYLPVDLHFGVFFISVLEPLIGPATVSTSVPMLIEVSGMPDLEFAIPTAKTWEVAPAASVGLLSAIDEVQVLEEAPSVYFQSGDFKPFSTKIPDLSQYCIGEKINSVKQLISRSEIYGTLGTSNTTVNIGPTRPLWLPSALAPTSNTTPNSTMINYFTHWFGLNRGGYHVDAMANNNTGVITSFLSGTVGISNNSPIIREVTGSSHIRVPYYNRYTKTALGSNFTNRQINPNVSFFSPTANGTYSLFVRAADDFQFGYFLGCPPLARLFDASDTGNTNFLTSSLGGVP